MEVRVAESLSLDYTAGVYACTANSVQGIEGKLSTCQIMAGAMDVARCPLSEGNGGLIWLDTPVFDCLEHDCWHSCC